MRYYLIPVVDSYIGLDNESLKEIFDREFPKLAKREDERVDILYSTRYYEPIPKTKLENHNAETRRLYSIDNVPTYLVATGIDEFMAREVVTGKKLYSKCAGALGIRETTKEAAENYFINNDYFNKVSNYFERIYGEKAKNIKLDSEPFAETYEGVAYLDGEIDGKPFSGKFTGTLRLSIKNRIN